MKPKFTVISSIALATIGTFIIFAVGTVYAIASEKSKYSKEDLAMQTKIISFNDSIQGIDASVLKIDYQVKDTNAVKVIVYAKNAALKDIAVNCKKGILNIEYTGRSKKFILQDAHVTIIAPAVSSISAGVGANITAIGNYTSNLKADFSSGAALEIDSFISKRLSAVASSGAYINISANNTDSVSTDASSGADIHFKTTKSTFIYSESTSGSSINLYGEAANVELGASSGAAINASELKATSGRASASSGANISCNVTNLSSNSSSGGSVSNNK